MPIQVIESRDPITNLIRLETSSVFELLFSLNALYHPRTRAEWVEVARASLPPEFLRALDAVYKPYQEGFLFYELAIDTPDQNDVAGFFDYVRALDPAEFVFYLVGRIVTVEDIARTDFDPKRLADLLQSTPYDVECGCFDTPFDAILADVPAFRDRLVDLWQWYWDVYFHTQIAMLRPHWEMALNDKQAIFEREGGIALYEHVTGRPELKPPLPPDYPVEEIVFIPIYFNPTPVVIFYGYGNITVVFDSERTQERLAQIEQGKDHALAILKALGDSSRLDIVRQIARREGMINGKQIAAKLKLSASAVSRHLGQLKEAGVITEETRDNRAITYYVQWDALKTLPDLLTDYLRH